MHTLVRVASLIVCAVLVTALLWPSIPVENAVVGIDKVAHTLIFFIMATGLSGALPGGGRWRIAAFTLVMAALTEFAQHWTGRDPDLLDFAANSVGVGVFVLLQPTMRRLRDRLLPRP
jgi:VanZ family protein